MAFTFADPTNEHVLDFANLTLPDTYGRPYRKYYDIKTVLNFYMQVFEIAANMIGI